ncbi:uncharacterized protein METZ01_LOCUS302715, partial [marine metagenome]
MPSNTVVFITGATGIKIGAETAACTHTRTVLERDKGSGQLAGTLISIDYEPLRSKTSLNSWSRQKRYRLKHRVTSK